MHVQSHAKVGAHINTRLGLKGLNTPMELWHIFNDSLIHRSHNAVGHNGAVIMMPGHKTARHNTAILQWRQSKWHLLAVHMQLAQFCSDKSSFGHNAKKRTASVLCFRCTVRISIIMIHVQNKLPHNWRVASSHASQAAIPIPPPNRLTALQREEARLMQGDCTHYYSK